MSLNSFLCKNFEKDANGNVTIGKIFSSPVVFITFWLSLLITLVRSIPADQTKFFGYGMNLTDMILLYFSSLFYAIITVLCFIIMFSILKYISNINVAKCPLKNDEIKEN